MKLILLDMVLRESLVS